MNRKEVRQFLKMMGRANQALKSISGTPELSLVENDKVKLNVEKIKSRKEYGRLSPEYREFIEMNDGRIFTVHIHRKRNDGFAFLIELKEEPRWLFVESDLVKVANGG